jgi:type I restriction enzyme, S subunit
LGNVGEGSAMITTLNLPQGWQKIRLKRIANLHPSKGEVANLSDDMVATFLPMEAVGESWKVDYSRTRPLSEVRNGYTYFRDGDILVAKITPCFENGKGALVNGCLNKFGFGTTEFHVIRSPDSETTRFLSYVVRSHRFKIEGSGMMTGTAGQKRLSDDYVKDFEVFLPPILEREKIAHFLGRKTAAIDTLVAKKQRLIQLLEEKRTALINQAVTKGLNPIAPMKESGISWIGKIPKHWEVKKIKFVCRLETGHTPSRTEKSYWVENECTIPWVSLNDTKTLAILDYISDTKYKISALGMANSSAHLIESGAVVFTRDATIGLAAITIRPMAVSQHIIAWVCLKNIINNRFLLNTIYAMNGELERLTMGSTIKTIGMSDVKELRMPVPPLDDQVNIANQIDEQQGKLKDVISKVKKQLDKLQEYRRSLITAAVTGKLAISEVEPDV